MERIESLDPDFEVVSMGRTLDIVKQVGSPSKPRGDLPKFPACVAATGIGHHQAFY